MIRQKWLFKNAGRQADVKAQPINADKTQQLLAEKRAIERELSLLSLGGSNQAFLS